MNLTEQLKLGRAATAAGTKEGMNTISITKKEGSTWGPLALPAPSHAEFMTLAEFCLESFKILKGEATALEVLDHAIERYSEDDRSASAERCTCGPGQCPKWVLPL